MAQEEKGKKASNNGAFAEGFNPRAQRGEEEWTEVKSNKRRNHKSKTKNEKETKTSREKRKSKKWTKTTWRKKTRQTRRPEE
eukprot:15322068-Ditylum_brightwellii.AAC.1